MDREKIIMGMTEMVVAPAGLIAHGRGEAFDYLLGETSLAFAKEALEAAACALLTAERPVLSVNGNLAALCAGPLVQLAREAGAALEINLFYRTAVREEAIFTLLKDAGAEKVLGFGSAASATIPEIGSERRRVDPKGILKSDVVFVPLEDGDRTEALVKMGKTVITVDLNPLSRTARKATITIVDNIVRAMPALVLLVRDLKSESAETLRSRLAAYNNYKILKESVESISERLQQIAATDLWS